MPYVFMSVGIDLYFATVSTICVRTGRGSFLETIPRSITILVRGAESIKGTEF